jgi:hypothetical protein
LLAAGICSLALSREGLRNRRFGKVYTEGTHVETVEETAKVLVEAAKRFVEQGEVHEVGFEISHAVAELAEGMFEGVKRMIMGSCGSAVGRRRL